MLLLEEKRNSAGYIGWLYDEWLCVTTCVAGVVLGKDAHDSVFRVQPLDKKLVRHPSLHFVMPNSHFQCDHSFCRYQEL